MCIRDRPVDVIGPIPLENVDIYLNSTWQSARQPEFLTLLNELNTLRANEYRYKDFESVMRKFLKRTV